MPGHDPESQIKKFRVYAEGHENHTHKKGFELS